MFLETLEAIRRVLGRPSGLAAILAVAAALAFAWSVAPDAGLVLALRVVVGLAVVACGLVALDLALPSRWSVRRACQLALQRAIPAPFFAREWATGATPPSRSHARLPGKLLVLLTFPALLCVALLSWDRAPQGTVVLQPGAVTESFAAHTPEQGVQRALGFALELRSVDVRATTTGSAGATAVSVPEDSSASEPSASEPAFRTRASETLHVELVARHPGADQAIAFELTPGAAVRLGDRWVALAGVRPLAGTGALDLRADLAGGPHEFTLPRAGAATLPDGTTVRWVDATTSWLGVAGPAVQVELTPADGPPTRRWLLLQEPEFDSLHPGSTVPLTVLGSRSPLAAVLSVRAAPPVPFRAVWIFACLAGLGGLLWSRLPRPSRVGRDGDWSYTHRFASPFSARLSPSELNGLKSCLKPDQAPEVDAVYTATMERRERRDVVGRTP